jgi:hypothetical protein
MFFLEKFTKILISGIEKTALLLTTEFTQLNNKTNQNY